MLEVSHLTTVFDLASGPAPAVDDVSFDVRPGETLGLVGLFRLPWQSGGLFTNSRSIPVNGLTPGANYNFQVRAIGGATGYSDWSDPVGHVSM